MSTHPDKTHENKSQSVSHPVAKKQGGDKSTSQFVDNSPVVVAQKKLYELANNSPQVKQLQAFQNLANSNQENNPVTQLQSISSNKPIQMYPGQNKVRRQKAKYKKKKADGKDFAEGVSHGGGIQSRYGKLDAPSEQDYYDDMLDEEAVGRERLENHPVAERARRYAMKPMAIAAKVGVSGLGNMVGGPVAGKVGGMAVDKAASKLDDVAKGKLNEGGNPYKVVREDEEES